MALFSNLNLTAAGQKAVNDYIIGTSKTPIAISSIAIGDGAMPKDTVNITALVHEVKRLPIETTSLDKGELYVTAQFATDNIASDITHREVGLYSGSTLIAYANAGNDYDYIPAAGQNTAVVKKISVRLTVGTVAVKMETLPADDYVTYDGAEQRLKELALPAFNDITDEYFESGRQKEDITEVVIEQLNEAEVSTLTTPEATATHTVSWVHLDARHTAFGKLDYITIDTSTQAQVEGEYALCVMEQDEVGGWQFLAESRSATHFQPGQPINFSFRGVELHGRAIRFFFAPPGQTAWTPDTFLRVSMRTSPVEGDDETLLHNGSDSYKFIPRFTLGYCAPRCAPYSHVDDTVAHLNKAEHQKLTSHLADTASHVGAADRTNWDGKAEPEDIELALYTPNDKSVTGCNDVLCFNYLHLDSPLVPTGELHSIDWQVRASDNVSFTHQQLSLGIFLPSSATDNNPAKLAVSTNKVNQVAGALMHFDFAPGTFLTGSPIRLVLLRDPSSAWDVYCKFGANVRAKTSADGATCIYNDGVKYDYVPQLTIHAGVPHFAPYAHVSDTTAHTNAAERSKWNKAVTDVATKAATTDLTSHTGDTVAHTNNAEKARWNDTYTVAQVDSLIAQKVLNAIRYEGEVASYTNLPKNAEKGDLYNVSDTGANYVWNGKAWDELKGDWKDMARKSELTSHTGNSSVHLNAAEREAVNNIIANPPKDGAAGKDGKNGATFTPSVSSAGVLSWTNNGGLSNPSPVNIKGADGKAGAAGAKGDKGDNGVTFTPSVSSAGVLSWTNNGNLQNPSSVNIKGATGAKGDKGDKGVTFTPKVAADGTLSWTNDGDLSNPASVNIKGADGKGLEIPYSFKNSIGQLYLGTKPTINNYEELVAVGCKVTASRHSVALGYGASSSDESVAIGNSAISYPGSVAIGYSTRSTDYSVAIGLNASTTTNRGSIAIGQNATVVAANNPGLAIALGNHAEATGYYAVALGNYALAKDMGTAVLCATIGTHERTQLYLVHEGSDLSTRCCNGKAALGYTVDDGDGIAPKILKSGWIALEDLCKNSGFSPTLS